MRLRETLGIDGSVAYAFLARLVSIAGSTGTVLLIVRFLSPIEQGYYYTLLSLVSMQMVFELGFSFVIQQLAAHESVHLEMKANGAVCGDAVAHARLASTLQLSLRWYTVAAAVMGLLLAPLGTFFFARHATGAAMQVAWQGPWLSAVAASMAGLWCMPFYSFLEGCGQVRAVAALRLRQAIAASLLAWSALLLHHGLYAPTLVIVGQVITGLCFLAMHRPLLMGLLHHAVGQDAIRWHLEVWPFQWRMAVSWMCSYFTVQIFIPILFALRGAVEAGQMGMSLSITAYMTVLALAWTSTKATPFGRMIARREFRALDQLFFTTFRQSLAVFAGIAVGSVLLVLVLPAVAPHLATRMLPARLFGLLVLGAAANHVVQSLGILLRCFKQEPFVVQSLVVALLTLLLAGMTASRWGNAGAVCSYLAVAAGVALPSAAMIFIRTRREYLAVQTFTPCEGDAV